MNESVPRESNPTEKRLLAVTLLLFDRSCPVQSFEERDEESLGRISLLGSGKKAIMRLDVSPHQHSRGITRIGGVNGSCGSTIGIPGLKKGGPTIGRFI